MITRKEWCENPIMCRKIQSCKDCGREACVVYRFLVWGEKLEELEGSFEEKKKIRRKKLPYQN